MRAPRPRASSVGASSAGASPSQRHQSVPATPASSRPSSIEAIPRTFPPFAGAQSNRAGAAGLTSPGRFPMLRPPARRIRWPSSAAWCSCDTVRPTASRASASTAAPTSTSPPRGARRCSRAAALLGRLPDLVVGEPAAPLVAIAAVIAGKGARVRLEADFREIDFGRWEGLTQGGDPGARPGAVRGLAEARAGLRVPGRRAAREPSASACERGLERLLGEHAPRRAARRSTRA